MEKIKVVNQVVRLTLLTHSCHFLLEVLSLDAYNEVVAMLSFTRVDGDSLGIAGATPVGDISKYIVSCNATRIW